MGKGTPKRRRFEIKKAQKKRKKIKKFVERYWLSKNKKEKEKILEKLFKLNPFVDWEKRLKEEKTNS